MIFIIIIGLNLLKYYFIFLKYSLVLFTIILLNLHLLEIIIKLAYSICNCLSGEVKLGIKSYETLFRTFHHVAERLNNQESFVILFIKYINLIRRIELRLRANTTTFKTKLWLLEDFSSLENICYLFWKHAKMYYQMKILYRTF